LLSQWEKCGRWAVRAGGWVSAGSAGQGRWREVGMPAAADEFKVAGGPALLARVPF
jgi:hypothetical protein